MLMIRGFKKVKCPRCGNKFRAAVIEDEATAESMPVHCPKCGHEVSLNHFRNIFKRLFGPAVLTITLFSSCSQYEDQHWDRMMKARQEIKQQDCVALRAVMRLGWAMPRPVNMVSGRDYFPFAVLTPGT